MRNWALAFLAVTAGASTLEAQQNCRKGIPCGNTCISASKVCRIGSGSARSVADPVTPAPARPAAPSSSLAPADATEQGTNPTSSAGEYPWVASFADGIYFRAGCSAAQDLAPPNRRYFGSEAAARDAGYRRTRVAGC
jgi:hypothetical protein